VLPGDRHFGDTNAGLHGAGQQLDVKGKAFGHHRGDQVGDKLGAHCFETALGVTESSESEDLEVQIEGHAGHTPHERLLHSNGCLLSGTRRDGNVNAVAVNGGEHPLDVGGTARQISIGEPNDGATGNNGTGPNCGALPPVVRAWQHGGHEPVAPKRFAGHLDRSVIGAVIDEDQLDVRTCQRRRCQRGDARFDPVGFAPHGNDHGPLRTHSALPTRLGLFRRSNPMTRNNAPTVSVVIPSWRAEHFIGETIRSVLDQTFTDFELVVMDDASPDTTVAVARAVAADDPRVRILPQQENVGPAANWNRAIVEATGRYVKLLCHDDVLEPTCLAEQVAALDAHPSAGMACARRHIIDARGRTVVANRGLMRLAGLVDGRRAVSEMVRCGTTPFGEPSVVLYRAAALQAAGPFTERFRSLIDCDAYARILRISDVVAIDATLARFRVHGASWSDRSHTTQAADARRLWSELRRDPEFGISRYTWAAGCARSTINSQLRRIVFALRR
jgi:glycosyltransferase involved in cell wall biosynthesis